MTNKTSQVPKKTPQAIKETSQAKKGNKTSNKENIRAATCCSSQSTIQWKLSKFRLQSNFISSLLLSQLYPITIWCLGCALQIDEPLWRGKVDGAVTGLAIGIGQRLTMVVNTKVQVQNFFKNNNSHVRQKALHPSNIKKSS